MRIGKGQELADGDNLPLALTRNLVTSSFENFYPIMMSEKDLATGFTVAHPAHKDARIQVTSSSCSSAGLTGRVVTTIVNGSSIKACISPQVPLPLTFRSEAPDGGVTEYVLEKYR